MAFLLLNVLIFRRGSGDIVASRTGWVKERRFPGAGALRLSAGLRLRTFLPDASCRRSSGRGRDVDAGLGSGFGPGDRKRMMDETKDLKDQEKCMETRGKSRYNEKAIAHRD
jgi:hypothetical protein